MGPTRNGQMLKYRYRQDTLLPVPISDDVVPVPISDDVVTVQLGIYDTAVQGLPRGRNIGSLVTPLIHIYGDSGIVPVGHIVRLPRFRHKVRNISGSITCSIIFIMLIIRIDEWIIIE